MQCIIKKRRVNGANKNLMGTFQSYGSSQKQQALVTESTLFSPANIFNLNSISFHGDLTYQ